jgi:D-alanine-D-alanine ligase
LERRLSNGKIRIGIIFGGRSGEHEVSLESARSVLAALNPQRYEVVQIGIDHDGAWYTGPGALDALRSGRADGLPRAALLPIPAACGPYTLIASGAGQISELAGELDVVFPILHGTFGEDGALQGLLELADLPYVGAGVLGSAVGMDKGIFKDVMRANAVPVVEWMVTSRREIENNLAQVLQQATGLGSFPLFVKPANLGSSVGVSRCLNRADLVEGLAEAARFDRRILIERGVNGREIEVSVLGNENPQASIPGEILPSREFYSYESKYVDGASRLLIPAPISPELARKVQELAVKAYRAIDCAGMARVDFLLDRDTDELYLNEVNTLPGFTSISMYPKLWEASGLPYPALVDRLVDLALERKAERDRLERRFRREDEV